MAQFIVINKHKAEECGSLMALLEKPPAQLKGSTLYCTCGAGEHAGYLVAESATPETLRGALPPAFRRGSTVLPVDVIPFR